MVLLNISEKLREKKKRLIDYLVLNKILKDERLIKAFTEVPLEEFIPEKIYEDNPLLYYQIYEDNPLLFYYQNEFNYRTISAPHMISIMIQGLCLEENDDLLILGAKSGYIAALAHKLCFNGEIIILEANSEVAKITRDNLKKLNLDKNVEVIVKNPLEGMPELSPWKKILVTGAISQERILPLLVQLDQKEGVLYAPIGEEQIQTYTQILRVGDEFYGNKQLHVKFTPLMTQLELDELELVTDFEQVDEIEIKDDPTKVEKTLNKVNEKYGKKVNIKYASSIFDNLELEKGSEIQSFSVKQRDIAISYLQNIEEVVNKLKKEEDVERCSSYINDIASQIQNLKKIEKSLNIKTKRIQSLVNQINSFNIVRKELRSKKDSKSKDKEMEIFNSMTDTINKFQEFVEEEVTHLKNL